MRGMETGSGFDSRIVMQTVVSSSALRGIGPTEAESVVTGGRATPPSPGEGPASVPGCQSPRPPAPPDGASEPLPDASPAPGAVASSPVSGGVRGEGDDD